jgi:hypothetical protein
MQNYENWKYKNSSSAIMEALNRGTSGNTVSSFGSVDAFISGLLGHNFVQEKPQISPINTPEHETVEDAPTPQDEVEDTPINQQIVQDEEFVDDEPEDIEDQSCYKIYRDKEEIFECNISVQGAKLSSSQVRLVLDHEICNLVFYGKINKDGKCVVPLKKMSLYPEKSSGRIRLEVIVEDTIFIPWEETFVVEGAKKVTVQIKSQKKVDFKF